ncbi:hypothetical protein [Algirhabdus cladophorae]|uniref:hypothetical protein n=1 Tax=Algirhabdus cladophorae TaxID=3377108 RepID=UPI003B848E04
MRAALHLLIAGLLAILTQIGGIAWLLSRLFRRKTLTFLALYAGLTVATVAIAPVFGRVALPCKSTASLQMHSPVFCVLNRHYVTPAMELELNRFAQAMAQKHPGTQTRILDANFPFIDGVPLLPHLSHNDGNKVDIALFYKNGDNEITTKTPSPLGYFAFEVGPTSCPKNRITLRWDMGWLKPLWRDLSLDTDRMKSALFWLAQNQKTEKIFVEPHLKARFAPTQEKVRFQGCRAARHDDHIHFQI